MLPLIQYAQTISGCWYGTAFVAGLQERQHNYMIELILTEKGPEVKGLLNYHFRNLYRSVPVNGKFDRKKQKLLLSNIPLIFYKSLENMDVDCLMDGLFTLVLARAGSTISGQWYPDSNYRYTCPPIQVRLSLDRAQPMSDSLIQAIKSSKEQNLVWAPSPTSDAASNPMLPPRTVNDFSNVQEQPKRIEEVVQVLEIEDDSVKIFLYDNGEVDGDSISIFLNTKLIASHQRLTNQAIRFTLPLDELLEYTDLTMFAENLGSIPPNTALMIVEGGNKTFQLRLSSTMEKSAKVRIKRIRKKIQTN